MLRRQLLDVRWRTLIHEMLHAHSVGYNRSAFDDFPGWEEGVVEKLQRLLRPQVLERLGITIPEAVFAEEEERHEFNPYIAALETLFRLVQQPGESEVDFYVTLLSTPISQRVIWMIGRGKQLPPDKFHCVYAGLSVRPTQSCGRRIKGVTGMTQDPFMEETTRMTIAYTRPEDATTDIGTSQTGTEDHSGRAYCS